MTFPIRQDILDFADAYLKGRYFLAKAYAVVAARRIYGITYITHPNIE